MGVDKKFKIPHQSLLESVDSNSFLKAGLYVFLLFFFFFFFFDWRIYFVTLFRNRLCLFVSSLVLIRLALLNNRRLFFIY